MSKTKITLENLERASTLPSISCAFIDLHVISLQRVIHHRSLGKPQWPTHRERDELWVAWVINRYILTVNVIDTSN